MKRLFTLALIVLCYFQAMSQTPNSINYQAVLRNSSGTVIASKPVSLRLSILQGSASGSAVYTETHSVSTNELGIVNLQIGNGSSSGDMSTVKWGDNAFYLKIELDENGGTSYKNMGTVQFASVPYAQYASKAGAVDGVDMDTTNELQKITMVGNKLTLSKNGGSVTFTSGSGDSDGDPTNELQKLSLSGTNITLSNGGGTVSIEDGDADASNEIQKISLSGTSLTLSNGGGTVSIEDGDADASNEIQKLSLSGTSLSLSNGGGSVSIEDADADASNELQKLSVSGNKVTLSNGGGTVTVDVDDADADASNELQKLSVSGNKVTLSNGGGTVTVNVDDADASATNEIQKLSISGAKVSLSNGGGSIKLDADSTNELQKLSISGNKLTLSNGGGTVTVSGGSSVWTETTDTAYYSKYVKIGNTSAAYGGQLTVGATTSSKITEGINVDLKGKVGGDGVFCIAETDKENRAFAGGAFSTSTNDSDQTGAFLMANGLGAGNHVGVETYGYGDGRFAIGGQFVGEASNVFSIGADGIANGTGTYNMGLRGLSIGSGTANYGVYGYAVNGSSNYAGYFAGDLAYTGSTYKVSDAKFKTNVTPLSSFPALEKIALLRPVSYQYRVNEFPSLHLATENQFGFIAQELKLVFPELVKSHVAPPVETMKDGNTSTSDTTGAVHYQGVNYIGLIPVLTQAIQEQQVQIETMNAEIEALKEQNKLLMELLSK